MAAPFISIKPKAGDILFVSTNTTGYYRYPKTKHLNDVATDIAKMILEVEAENDGPISFVDFGGVSSHHLLKENGEYYDEDEEPKAVKDIGTKWIFSFVPTNKKFKEIPEMAFTGVKAGFAGTIIVTKKEGDRGKADLMNALAAALPMNANIVYYEDTASVLDDVGDIKVRRVWVQPPASSEFHDMKPKSHDIDIYSVDEYLNEMLDIDL